MIDDKWHIRFLRLAAEVSSWSKDPSTQVGCVLVSPDRRFIHPGYNGLPSGIADTVERLSDRDRKLALTIHAEENAILNARGSVAGYSAYVTRHPCVSCAAKLIQSGVAEVHYLFHEDFETRWRDSLTVAGSILREAGVRLEPYHPTTVTLGV